ncbi:TPA: hypothetical protein I9148_002313 [Clostridium perfringens]|nr:hypothetical protein [Clostridium perfringens]
MWQKFYINYEECKSKGEVLKRIAVAGFILTMRNVNTGSVVTENNGDGVLY